AGEGEHSRRWQAGNELAVIPPPHLVRLLPEISGPWCIGHVERSWMEGNTARCGGPHRLWTGDDRSCRVRGPGDDGDIEFFGSAALGQVLVGDVGEGGFRARSAGVQRDVGW